MDGNPFFETWNTPFGVPPFERIGTAHFLPAIEAGIAAQTTEIEAIASSPEPADFANTIEAFERSGEALRRVVLVFRNLSGTLSDEPMRAVERDAAPLLARHRSAVYLNPPLFARIDAVFSARQSLGLNAEPMRLLERIHKNFVRAGARLDTDGRARLGEITERLATLGTQFSQNILKDETAFTLKLHGDADLQGLPEEFRAGAAALAAERGIDASHAVSLSRGSVETFLAYSARRDLRETLLNAFLARGGNGGDSDNSAIIAQTAALRAERARLLGYATYADYKLDDTMAQTPKAVRGLLDRVWSAGKAQAAREQGRLQEMIRAEGGNFALAAHDWRYYSEKLLRADYSIDEAELRSYFPLDGMIEAAFFVAGKLFGLAFEERRDIPLYHPDVRAFEAKDAQGRHVALFLGDYFARPSKHSGAWMSAFRAQRRFGGQTRPVIVNVLNAAKPAAGNPALLSLGEAHTLFHEFGHALHGMLSNVTYATLSGTAVSTDFVELPSQLFEHWLLRPEVLRRFARHARTGEPLPEALLERVRAARRFNQGFNTVEYCASAYVDLDLHSAPPAEAADPMAFERAVLARIGKPNAIPMRHRGPHFSHVFSGEGYAAGYYSYLWSEVLDADAFAAFEETGDAFNPELAAKLREFIYSAGNLRDPKEAYIAFRGRLPSADALLAKRGLSEATA